MDYVTTFQEGNHQLKFQMELIRNLGHSNAAEEKLVLPANGFLLKADTRATPGGPAWP